MEPQTDWSTLQSTALCEFPWLGVYRERVATPSRPDGTDWVVARRPAAVVIAPRTPDGDYLLIRQERIPVRRDVWEFPAGQINHESPEATAHRELGEEAGMECHQPLVPLGTFFSSVGFTDEFCHLFLAPDVRPAPHLQAHTGGEVIHETRRFPREEFRSAIASGLICDANTLACFARLTALNLF